MTSASVVLRGSANLLVGRVAQAVLGVAILALTTRTLDVRGFGEFATGLAVASLVGGMLNAALSDAYVASEGTRHPQLLTVLTVLLTAVCAGASGLLARDSGLALSALAVGCFVSASVATAGRLGAARADNRSVAIAVVQLVGSVGTLGVIGALALADSHRWQLFLLAYAIQPAALGLLRPAERALPGSGLRGVWRASRMFVASQVGWTVLSQANIVVLRVIVGADAAGRYAALVRLLDFLAVVAPLMAVLALPAFVTAHRADGDLRSAARMNTTIACAGTVVLVAGMQFGWLGWRLLYGDQDYPALTFAIVGLGYGVSAACGLPDRLLQARGSSGAVASFAGVAAGACVVLGSVLSALAGAQGAAVALAVVLTCVNVGMLRLTSPPPRVVAAHALLGCVALLGACLVLAGDPVRSLPVSLSLATLLALAASAPMWLLRDPTDRRPAAL
ncbi:MAG: lipopolysaccharide biosynthesis protein [Mycobacteriales bacterium]